MESEGIHEAVDEIWCQMKDYILQMMHMVSEEGLYAADEELWCQRKDYMLQMMTYIVRRIACCS